VAQADYEQSRTGVLAGGYLRIDEAPIEYLQTGNDKTKLGYLRTSNHPADELANSGAEVRAAQLLVFDSGASDYPSHPRKVHISVDSKHSASRVHAQIQTRSRPPVEALWFSQQSPNLLNCEVRVSQLDLLIQPLDP
jgi:hypothetical protein